MPHRRNPDGTYTRWTYRQNANGTYSRVPKPNSNGDRNAIGCFWGSFVLLGVIVAIGTAAAHNPTVAWTVGSIVGIIVVLSGAYALGNRLERRKREREQAERETERAEWEQTRAERERDRRERTGEMRARHHGDLTLTGLVVEQYRQRALALPPWSRRPSINQMHESQIRRLCRARWSLIRSHSRCCPFGNRTFPSDVARKLHAQEG